MVMVHITRAVVAMDLHLGHGSHGGRAFEQVRGGVRAAVARVVPHVRVMVGVW